MECEHLDHYLIYDETETEDTICNVKPKGDYWFHDGKEIPKSEAEKKLKELKLNQ